MKKKYHASPFILAILCAVGVHTVLFTDAGHRLQGAITESSTSETTSEASLILKNNTVSLVIQKDISQVSKITASLVYNDESLLLSQPESPLGDVKVVSEEYSQNVTLTAFQPQNIQKGEVIATWEVTRVLPEIHTINLSDVQVDSGTGITKLSTQGTGEF